MKKVRVISLFLLLALFCVAAVVAASSAGTPTITVSSAEAAPEAEAAVTVAIKDHPGLVNMQLFITYDSSLTLVNVEDGKILGESVHTKNLSLNPYPLTWQNDTAEENFTANGTLATLTFKVAEGASGTLPISVSYDNARGGILNFDMETVEFSVENGGVTVKAASHTHTWDKGTVTTAATCKEEGVKTFTCTECKQTKTERIAIDKSNHNGYGTELKNAKPAGKTEAGYTGDKICKGCGATLEKGSVIPPTGNLVTGINLIKHSQKDGVLRVAVSLKDCKDLASGKCKITYDSYIMRAVPIDNDDSEPGADAIRLKESNNGNAAAFAANSNYSTGLVECAYYFKKECETDDPFEIAVIPFEVLDRKAASVPLSLEATYRINGSDITEKHDFSIALDAEPKGLNLIMGDVDGDGEITSGDARLALRASVQLEDYVIASAPYIAADADCNGRITSGDARLILRGSVGLEKTVEWDRYPV